MKTEEIFEQIQESFGDLQSNHEKTTKVSNRRARTACTALGKLLKEYKRASLEESK